MLNNSSFSTPVVVSSSFDGGVLWEIQKWYAGVHGYLSILVCMFGIPMNLINITVLTRRHMRTPINCILTWLAAFDMFTMMSYVPFALHFYCVYSPWNKSPEKNSIYWMHFMMFHINFSATTHTVSIWLGVTLAIFRYKHIFSPAKGHLTRMRRLVRARLAVLLVVALSVVGLIPNYLMNQLVEFQDPKTNETQYGIKGVYPGDPKADMIVKVNLWLYSIGAKFLPCVLMVVYGGLLLTTLRASLRQRMRRMSTLSITSNGALKAGSGGTDNSRTTRLLLVVIVLFVVTELPQAVLLFISINLKNFFINVYVPLGDIMDIVALMNNGINFVLYCSMSRDFRNTVVALIKGGVGGFGAAGRRAGREDLGYSCRSSSLRPPCSPVSRASTTGLGPASTYNNGFLPLTNNSDENRSHSALTYNSENNRSRTALTYNSDDNRSHSALNYHNDDNKSHSALTYNSEDHRSHTALVVRLSDNSSAETICTSCKTGSWAVSGD